MRLPLFAAAVALMPMAALAQPYGIDSRVSNDTLRITDLPPTSVGTMNLVQAFPNVPVNNQVLMIQAPGDSSRFFVVQQEGRIRVFPNVENTSAITTFLDIQDRVLFSGEQGLLGMAFDPDYMTNGVFYVYYSYGSTNSGTGPTRVARFTNPDPADNSVDPATEQVILSISQPFSNHNGGMIEFGPDNYLYVGTGDGGSGGDPQGNGQNTSTLLGKMLRLDVRGQATYAIPPDNPFAQDVGGTRRKEIYAWGLRNPWRWSHDPITGRLFCADVGQNAIEEIDIIERGKNYGWNIREGNQCYPSSVTNCQSAGLEPAIFTYTRSSGNSVTGGYVYTGTAVPELYGRFIFGDYGSGRIWALAWDGSSAQATVIRSSSSFDLTGFGKGHDGEVYVLNYGYNDGTTVIPGAIYRLRPAAPSGNDFPSRLSAIPALLTAAGGNGEDVPGVIPYAPSSALWSDRAHKERYMALPGVTQATYQPVDGWDFPEETVLIKNFSLPTDLRDPDNSLKRIETRLLYRKDNSWYGFSYEWNDEETDGLLLTTGKSRPIQIIDESGAPITQVWDYPSSTECFACHTNDANFVLGLSTPQMNSLFHYPLSGVTDNQIRTLDHISFFDISPGDPADLPAMPDYNDTGAPIRDRARAYLAANCAQCHRPGGQAPALVDFRWGTADEDMNAINRRPIAGYFNTDPGLGRVIAIGDPDNSVLLSRISTTDTDWRMPPLGTHIVDENGVEIIRQWILSLQDTYAGDTWMMY